MKKLLILILICVCAKSYAQRIDCPVDYLKGKPHPPACVKISEYNPGKLMGYSYNVESGIWFDSTNSRCCTCFQNDLAIIDARLNNHQTNVVYLDFTGGVCSGQIWGEVTYAPSGLTESQVAEVVSRVQSHYQGRNVTFTTDYNTYANTPTANRQQVIFTTTCGWYGCGSGGTASVNSFGGEITAWVFTYPLNYNTHNIGESGAHETGHTLGLLHQSVWQ